MKYSRSDDPCIGNVHPDPTPISYYLCMSPLSCTMISLVVAPSTTLTPLQCSLLIISKQQWASKAEGACADVREMSASLTWHDMMRMLIWLSYSVFVSVCLYVCTYGCVSIYLSVDLSICLSPALGTSFLNYNRHYFCPWIRFDLMHINLMQL